ncbi:DNA-binding MarR family transcriptional regulator [Thalassospira sp. MBR-102]|jgi:DNA-binding MarR family transcriptional regulator|uniref:MarR family transcriptional regulator n=2 Tax=Thalassospira xiamenensis TaxID=220697 RepID=A0ABR5XYW8_9PROT|nr:MULTISPECIES: MarR family transcriptional regulator [Thalassospira]AJD54130.1 MarR family transcriptional regulator [Thalassospira xiamenensis M-5 = DSM 17429]KZD01715.1 MarR family transcriptional regulator [Thalassospira xiamenensis]KZD11198.1 MarR family transcriptional regulator [Thalassospira xiamenensis]MAB32643.1 MarR family transcriptional regulator [Thalassospira sp.]MBA05822.1 MarR family transcriptional regulator [Thalassospira sp.]|tara:strand:+ start:1855 stop:2322 length:468 start_codon:yes stop_codon:yes gene_type:complete
MSKKDFNQNDKVPFSSTLMVRDSCLCLHVRRAARTIARRFDDAFRPLDLTSGQYSLLMSLNRPHPPHMQDVADLLAMDRTTLTANLKPLERRGLVAIDIDPKDKRSRLLTLTDQGMALLVKAFPIWQKTQKDLNALVANSDSRHLLTDLINLTNG